MKSLAFFAFFALCTICFAEDAPELLLPCSFHSNFKLNIRNMDGEILATSMNEMLRDNGDYWVWKSSFEGNDFIKTLVPDHAWSITWRPDLKRVFRHDMMANKCYNMSYADQPLPYEWIQSKTYGIVWYDEMVSYGGQECYLLTALIVGKYSTFEYELEGNFYVSTADNNVVYVNGTVSADKGTVQLRFDPENIFFEHNVPIPTKSYVISAPCPSVAAPAEPSADFAAKCYGQNNGYMLTVSWIALVAMLIALLNF